MDFNKLTAGATLYLPVFHAGAQFFQAHAQQLCFGHRERQAPIQHVIGDAAVKLLARVSRSARRSRGSAPGRVRCYDEGQGVPG